MPEPSQNFSGKNLRGHSFKHKDLTGADFSDADICGANFTRATLTGANFTGAKAGVQKRWLIVQLILCLLLSALSGVFIGYMSWWNVIYQFVTGTGDFYTPFYAVPSLFIYVVTLMI